MQRLEVSGAVRPIYGSLGVKRLTCPRLSSIFAEIYVILLTCLEKQFETNVRARDAEVQRTLQIPLCRFSLWTL